MTTCNRRVFTQTVACAAAAAAFSTGVQGANDRIRLGFIGLGNRGDQVLDAFLKQPDAEVVAVCDLDQSYLDFASKKAGTRPQQYKDYRRLLDQKNLDAVVISTPDHWHALQTVHACEAGKDVYVEKPLSLRVAEGRAMVAAVRRHGRVCQVGIHRRSADFCRQAAEFVREGGLGKITVARAFHVQNEWPRGIGNPPDSAPPPGFDWDAWLGPAPFVPYNKNRTFYRFRWFYGYSGGQVTNFGVHYLDFIQWSLGQPAPRRVTALGGRFAGLDDNRAYEGRWRQGQKPQIESRKVTGDGDTSHHARNFLDCVKSRQTCPCDIETGHRSTTATLIANIALQRRRVLDWDATQERFSNDDEANRWLRYDYRPPYRWPEI